MVLDYFTGVFNICTDLLVFIVPTMVVWNLQISRKNRSIVIAAFATRPIYVRKLFYLYGSSKTVLAEQW